MTSACAEPEKGRAAPGGEELSSAETSQLLARYKETGEEELKWEIVLRCTDLVKKAALQARGLFSSFAQLDDVIHEGILVLLNAVEKFDPSKGIKFETYIAKRLRGMMVDLARRSDWVPRQIRQKAVRLNRAAEELSAKLGCLPSGKEMAEYLGMSLEDYEELRTETAFSSLMSFEALLDSNSGAAGAAPEEQLPAELPEDLPEEACQEKEMHEVLCRALESLRDNERLVLSLYYEKELTMKEIAQVMGVSAPRISQLHSGAIQRLRLFIKQYMEE